MNTTKKQWIAPEINELENESTQGGPTVRTAEVGEFMT